YDVVGCHASRPSGLSSRADASLCLVPSSDLGDCRFWAPRFRRNGLHRLTLLARYCKRPVVTGVFLTIAVLLKLYPLVLLPALYRRGDVKMPSAAAAVLALGYAAYSSVGLLV